MAAPPKIGWRLGTVFPVFVAIWLMSARFPGLDPVAFAQLPIPDADYSKWVVDFVHHHNGSLRSLHYARLGVALWLIGSAVAAWRRGYVPMVLLIPIGFLPMLLADWLFHGDFVMANNTSVALPRSLDHRVTEACRALGEVAGRVYYTHGLLIVWCILLGAAATVSWWRARGGGAAQGTEE